MPPGVESALKKIADPCAVRVISVENVSEMRIVNSASGRMVEHSGSSCGRYMYEVVDIIGLSDFSSFFFLSFFGNLHRAIKQSLHRRVDVPSGMVR